MEKTIKIGLCGLGTVGSGVFRLLTENSSVIGKRVGANVRVTKAATKDRYDNLGLDFSQVAVSDSVDDILNDPEIDIVVELIGGSTLAKRVVLETLEKGKSVVTANKALLAEHSEQIFKSAYRSEGYLGYEASVGGGIPIIKSIKDGFSGDRIDEISGIVNGTANYILSSMTNLGTDFASALKDAQQKGYAEADPTFDIEGIDAAHKVILLMELAFNTLFEFKQLHVEGITGIEPVDIETAKEFGYAIKLLGKARRTQKGFEGRVHPALVEQDSMLASVQGAFNAVSVYGNFVGHIMNYGAGAGSHPTASAVAGDIIEISRFLTASQANPVPPLAVALEDLEKQDILPIGEIETEYYLRIGVKEQAEALKDVVGILSENDIRVRSMIRKKGSDDSERSDSIVILTDKAVEKHIQTALESINSLSFVTQPIKLIRIDS
ncbi:MAG: homoserine dehydrogenase [Proteobacteria bacterium]|nr:homoserine dehydrogenase [Pseudomonadota bacterium]